MTEKNWRRRIGKMPRGLTYHELASRWGLSYQAARRMALRHRYPASDGRKFAQVRARKIDPSEIDWSLSNVAIARQLLVSRERVRLVRKEVGAPFVESRGRRPLSRKSNHHKKHTSNK